ncbi:MAG: flagellar hook-associated protein FlgK [Lachnospiraceae bacterium]|nr:flagellar hook-associated protein FlgK [Lachnospiraceae bacterium]
MPSQFFGLNIAYTGLLAANASLNTTSNNIANVQTEGYSRQRVVQQASDALRVFQTYGCAGAGVDTLAVERIRDEFYDKKFWTNNTMKGEYDKKLYYMQQVENYFNDDKTTKGFTAIFNTLMINGLQALMDDPSSSDKKLQFIGYADSLTSYFKGMSANLEKIQKDVNQEIKLKIDEINSLSSEIASLNKQINVIEMNGSMANELRDRRTLLLDQLSAITDIETQEIPITDPYNPDMQTGGNRFIVRIAGGQMLVETENYRQMECVARKNNEKVNQSDIDGLYDIKWTDTGEDFNLYNSQIGGELQGLIEMRDGNNKENFNGVVERRDTVNIDGVDHDTVTVKVNSAFLKDLNKCNLSDTGGKINLGNQIFNYDSWSYTCTYPQAVDEDGNPVVDGNGDPVYDTTQEPTCTYTFVMSAGVHISTDRTGKAASVGASIDYQGIPYYMNQMNEWIRTYAQKFNDILVGGFTSSGEQGTMLFTGSHGADDEQYQFPGGQGGYRYDRQAEDGIGSITVGMNDDSYYKLTAKNFDIYDAMMKDPDLLATKKTQGDGAEQNDLLRDLKQLSTDEDKMSYRGGNAGEFLDRILSDVALNTGNAQTFYDNYRNIVSAVDTQRISISGVDEDEEAVSLVKYQNAYNLASRMIQTLSEIYNRLILETGV